MVRVAVKGGQSWFRGLVYCANPWACPLCAYRISRHRAEKVQRGVDAGIANGGGVTLITLTFRHDFEMQLDDTMAKMSAALRRLKSGRAYVELKKKFRIYGEIRALEVTHGQNGWHPHTHAITFTDRPIIAHRLTQLKRELFVLWYRACKKENLPLPTYAHGVDCRGAKYAADYVAKWGFASELTRGHLKKANGGGRNPWQLLADAHTGDKRAGWLFREFAMAFKGHRQLLWSRGLGDYLGVNDDLPDQQVLDLDEVVEVEHEFFIENDDWRIVRKYGQREALLNAALEGREAFDGFIAGMRYRARCDYGIDGKVDLSPPPPTGNWYDRFAAPIQLRDKFVSSFFDSEEF